MHLSLTLIEKGKSKYTLPQPLCLPQRASNRRGNAARQNAIEERGNAKMTTCLL
jgi:hypothetical protein